MVGMCGQKRFKYKLWGPDFDYYVAECSPMDIQMVELGMDDPSKKKSKKRKKHKDREHRRSEINVLKSHRLDMDDEDEGFDEELPPAYDDAAEDDTQCNNV